MDVTPFPMDDSETGDVFPAPTNGKAHAAQPTPKTSGSSSKPSTHPAKKSGLDRTQFSDPNLAKPVGEQTGSKQTTFKIKKPEGRYFRIHPSDSTRLYGATVMFTKGKKLKILTNGVSAEKRAELSSIKDTIKVVDLYLACDEDGSIFVTYFSASSSEAAETWVDSGRIVVQQATKEWIAIAANMHEGGYRVDPARSKFTTLAASKPAWELEGADDPTAIFESVVMQNLVETDNSVSITTLLAARK